MVQLSTRLRSKINPRKILIQNITKIELKVEIVSTPPIHISVSLVSQYRILRLSENDVTLRFCSYK